MFEEALDSMTTLVSHIDELTAVFEDDYKGGDFCAGLTFGYTGSNLLVLMAESMLKQAQHQ